MDLLRPEKLEKQKVKAVVFTKNNLKIEGVAMILKNVRLSDEIGSTAKSILNIIDATISSIITGKVIIENEVVIINKQHIVCAVPIED